MNLRDAGNTWNPSIQTPIKERHGTRTSIGGIHSGVVSCRARRRRPRTSPLASECRRSRSNGHNGPAGELVKRRIRGPIIYFHTIHVRRPALGRSAGVTPSASIVPRRRLHAITTLTHAHLHMLFLMNHIMPKFDCLLHSALSFSLLL